MAMVTVPADWGSEAWRQEDEPARGRIRTFVLLATTEDLDGYLDALGDSVQHAFGTSVADGDHFQLLLVHLREHIDT